MNGLTLGLLLVLSGLVNFIESTGNSKTFCPNCCALQFKTHGCYKDSKDRDLPNLVLYERYSIDWTNWKVYMYDFICRCAYAAKNNGDTFFGIQFWGECWSSKTWSPKLGKSTKCYGDAHKPCNGGKYCVGMQWSNFIYEIVDLPCKIKMKYKGCWKDAKIRALKKYYLTGRENLNILSTQVGRIDWQNYNTWLPRFICHCAKLAKDTANSADPPFKPIFGVQFWGECWMAKYKGDGSNYKMYGEKNAVCYDNCFRKCDTDSDWCVGQRWSNAVYKVL